MSIDLGRVEVRKASNTAHAILWLLSFALTGAGTMKTHSSGVYQLELSPLSNLLAQPTFKTSEADLSLSMENEDSF